MKTTAAAARIAKLHENELLHTPTKSQQRVPFSPSRFQNLGYYQKTPLLSSPRSSDAVKPNFIPRAAPDRNTRKYTFQEIQERKNKGLCIFCEEPFTPGHQLKHIRSQIFVMDGEEEDFFESEPAADFRLEEIAGYQRTMEEPVDKSPTISLNALNGSTTFNCMRMVGQYGKKKLHILIDPGSTHNFMDLQVAKALDCKLEQIKPMSVAAANGLDMVTGYKCAEFTWRL